MRSTIQRILAVLLLASPGLAAAPPVIDGVITPGEWDDFYLDTLITDWPHFDQSAHTWVDVYLAQDRDNWYLAYVADPSSDGWLATCEQNLDATHKLTACGDPASQGEPGCNDPYACQTAKSLLFLWMGGLEATASRNKKDCSLTEPEPLGNLGIESGYFGPHEGCPEGDTSFRTELKIPKSVLSGAKQLIVGGFQWQSKSAYANEDRDGDGFPDCSCAQGVSIEIPVTVDIKPSNVHNCINLGSESNIKVAILATDDYDPLDSQAGVFCRTVEFLGVNPGRCRAMDVNSDGRKDLVAFYRGRTLLKKGEFDCDATTTEITGMTSQGIPIRGEDAICYLGNQPCP